MNDAPWGSLLVRPAVVIVGLGLAIGCFTMAVVSQCTAKVAAPEAGRVTDCQPIRILRDGTFFGWRCDNYSSEIIRVEPAKLERWLNGKCADGSAELEKWREWGVNAKKACRDEAGASCPFEVCSKRAAP